MWTSWAEHCSEFVLGTGMGVHANFAHVRGLHRRLLQRLLFKLQVSNLFPGVPATGWIHGHP